jgi:hypothetical protein
MAIDFDKAIVAHAQWKGKLAAYLRGPDGSLKPEEVGRNDRCDLGKWIQTEGGKAPGAGFATLKAAHARFHKAAGDIVRRANKGEKVSEEVALGAASEYATATSAVVTAITAMRTATAPR